MDNLITFNAEDVFDSLQEKLNREDDLIYASHDCDYIYLTSQSNLTQQSWSVSFTEFLVKANTDQLNNFRNLLLSFYRDSKMEEGKYDARKYIAS
jgi:hypothetical protein